MEQATPSAGRYQGCIGTREDSVADRVVVRPANWGPRAVWHRILDRASRFWRVGLAALVSVLVIWAGRGLLSDEVEEAVVEVEEVNTQPAEQILQGDVLDHLLVVFRARVVFAAHFLLETIDGALVSEGASVCLVALCRAPLLLRGLSPALRG